MINFREFRDRYKNPKINIREYICSVLQHMGTIGKVQILIVTKCEPLKMQNFISAIKWVNSMHTYNLTITIDLFT